MEKEKVNEVYFLTDFRLDRFSVLINTQGVPFSEQNREKFNAFVQVLQKRLIVLKKKEEKETKEGKRDNVTANASKKGTSVTPEGGSGTRFRTSVPGKEARVTPMSEETVVSGTEEKKKREKRVYTKETRELYKAEAILRKQKDYQKRNTQKINSSNE